MTTSEPTSKTRLKLWLRLLKYTRQIEGELRENLRTEFQTTLPRFDVMAALERFPDGLRMSELSSVLKVSNGNVTVVVDRLEKDELIERLPVPGDRRASRVQLTKTGKTEFARQAAAHEEWIDQLMGALTSKDATDTSALLDQAIQAMDKDA